MDEHSLDPFDVQRASFDGVPGVLRTKPSLCEETTPLTGTSVTYIIETVRRPVPSKSKDGPERFGYTIFLQVVTKEGTVRVALPPRATDLIASQRDSLSGRARKAAAKAAVVTRRERGIVPFQKKGA